MAYRFRLRRGLIDDVSRIEIGEVRQARQECIDRLQEEMRQALEENSLATL